MVESDTTASAGFNDLVQMQTAIVDGAQLGTNFVIYSSTEAMLMEYVGGQLIFAFRKLFSDEGLINQNCVVEVDGKHFCFGNNDIFARHVNTKQSLCDERVRQFIFKGLNKKNSDRCFVQHNKVLSEIMFCYQSGDEHVSSQIHPGVIVRQLLTIKIQVGALSIYQMFHQAHQLM